ncbi:hypothetical protein [Mycolicibacterium goodii]|uniref:Uncharacterized protein n=1 Tax=Mycolicibacterium goodii TaxID=134601 RepID=A0A0K0XEM8_MYCGD|nr:hypothetical protein AFA91_32565 [Mycolicibacterium goodii]
MSSVLSAIPDDARAVIEDELARRNPELLRLLQGSQRPTIEQSHALIDALSDALSENYEPGHIPNERGRAIDHAIGAYLLAWPIDRRRPE